VLASGGDPDVYAESILKVCKFYVQSPIACAAGVSGANLKKRIEAIMRGSDAPRLGGAKKIVLAMAGVVAFAGPVAAGFLARPVDTIALLRAEQEAPRTAISYDPKKFDKYVGYYQMNSKMVVTVYRKDNHLLARFLGGMACELYAESESKFFATVVPAQLSFVTDARGQVTEVVHHQYGIERRGKRIENSASVSEVEMELRRAGESSDTEASLRKYIHSLEKGEPNYDEMMPDQAVAVHAQLPRIKASLARWGALQSVAFRGITELGADIYDVAFENGRVEWFVAPLTADGKVRMRSFREVGVPAGAQSSNVQ
jgi:hypothetical protein